MSEALVINIEPQEVSDELTSWENPPTIEDLKNDYDAAKVSHSAHVTDVDEWLNNRNMEGSARPNKIVGRSSVAPKLIRKQNEWRYAPLADPFLSTDSLFTVAPRGANDRESAYQNQLILNQQFNIELDKTRFIGEYVRTAVDEGTVITRVGWDYEEEVVKVEVPKFAMVPLQDPLKIQAAVAAGLPPVEKLQIGTEIVEQVNVIKNQPVLEICDYNNVIIDPSCQGNYDRAEFIIFPFETSLSELKRDGKYSNLDQIKVAQNSPLAEPDVNTSDAESSFNFTDKPRKKFIAYEYWGYWDIHGTGMVEPFVATWVGNTLIRMEENPYPDKKLPFVIVQYLPVRRSNYGEPDGALLEDNQKIIGAVTRGMIDIMARSANGQMGTRKDALDVTNKRKFDRGGDYEFNSGVDPRQAFYMHTFPEIPNSAYQMLQMQNAEAESLTGVKAFSTGIGSQALGNVATGIRGALDAASKRELDILNRLSDGISKIGQKIVSMNAEFLSDEEIVRITDQEFIAISRDRLAGKFDLKVTVSTAESDNKKAEELAFMLQTMGNNQDPEITKMIQVEIARLRKMPELADKIANYKPQPNPLAQKKAELEIALLEAQIADTQGSAIENKAGAALDFAKAEKEQATTRNIDSITDRQDLDFVEQESGVTQERALEQTSQQAKSNMALKAFENNLKNSNPDLSGTTL